MSNADHGEAKVKASKGKPLSNYEQDAQRVVEQHLGVPVVQHDDNTAPRMPDLRIEYPDRPHAVVEVGRDVDRQRVGQAAAIDRKWPTVLNGLRYQWSVVVQPGTVLAKAIDVLHPLLQTAEQTGRHRFGQWDYSHDPLDQALKQAGFANAWAHVQPPGVAGRLAIYQKPMGWWELPSERINQWCEEMFAEAPDIARKLKLSGYAERHAFLFSAISGSPDVASLFLTPAGSPGAVALPESPPALPDGVDRVWIRGANRIVAWFPDGGWHDVL